MRTRVEAWKTVARAIGLLLLGAVLPSAHGQDAVVERILLRFEAAELRIDADLGVRLVGFVVPASSPSDAPFEADLVDPRRLEACRLRPHLVQVRVLGDARRYWRFDTEAGRAWVVTDGVFGSPGGTPKAQGWVQVEPSEDGAGAVAVLRDLELTYMPASQRLVLEGGGLNVAEARHFRAEMPTASTLRVAPTSRWGGGHLVVDLDAREVRFIREAHASERALGESDAAEGERLDLPLTFWRTDGRYDDAESSVPRLLEPAVGALLDNGRRDGLDLRVHEFRWTDVPGADAYRIVVQSRTAADPEIDEETTHPFYRTEGREPVVARSLDDWEWKVRAIRGKEALPWSEVRAVRIEPPNADPPDGSAPLSLRGPVNPSHAPDPLRPKEDAILDNGRADGKDPLVWEFRWGRVSKAREYELVVLRDTEYPLVRARVKGTKHRFESRDLRIIGLGRTGWHWRVRALGRGEARPWSAPSPFAVEPLDTDPAEDEERPSRDVLRRTPRLLTPKPSAVLPNGERNRKKEIAWVFRWASVAGVQGYEIQLHQRGALGGPRTARTEKTSYEHEFAHVIEAIGCYGHTWRVRAVFEEGPGPWSPKRSFDVEDPRRSRTARRR